MSWRRAGALATVLIISAAALAAWGAGRLLVVDVPMMGPEIIVSLASHEWERLPELARLARDHPRAAIVLTQPGRPTAHNCHDCPNRVSRLGALGVPASRVVVLAYPVGSTRDEAVAVLGLVKTTGARRVLVVTSRFHTRRALAIFRHVLRPVGASVGVSGAPWPEARPGRWWGSPYGRWYVTREWAASLYYAVRFPGFVRQLPLRPW